MDAPDKTLKPRGCLCSPPAIVRYGKVHGRLVQGDPPITRTAREW